MPHRAARTSSPASAAPKPSTPTSPRQASDKITDYDEGDTIALQKDVFPGIGPLGVLKAKHFHIGDEAETEKQTILYDEDSGWLLYAENGSNTANPVAFAKVGKNLDGFDNGDILVI